MPTPDEMKEKFWNAVKSDRTMMVGLNGAHQSHTRPMTALRDGETGPIWFFSSTDSELVRQSATPQRALATFVDKGHGLFACIHGTIVQDTDRAMVDRLWNPFVAAWYDGGKTDPKLVLLRLDPGEAEIWHDGSSLLSAIRILLGGDPQKDFSDSVAKVRLS